MVLLENYQIDLKEHIELIVIALVNSFTSNLQVKRSKVQE
jgi:hypothetical protein